jgi:hypothetical protein
MDLDKDRLQKKFANAGCNVGFGKHGYGVAETYH